MIRTHFRSALLLGVGSALLPTVAWGADEPLEIPETAAPTQSNADSAQIGSRLNTTGRPIILTVPAKDGANYLGDIALTIQVDDTLEFPTQRALQLLSQVLSPDYFLTLEKSLGLQPSLSPNDFVSSGIKVSYNPRTLELNFIIPAELRISRSVIVSPLDRDRIGSVIEPAGFSAYLNIRATADYIHAGGPTGFNEPLMILDGAARLGGVVAESEAIWQPGVTGVDFQRLGSRFVYDDLKNLVRWTAGDLQPLARGFQNSPDIAGLSIFRSYSVLQPQQIIRPRGDRSFRLDRPSTIEVEINGQIIRRLELAPGNYNLRDFPFAQGANNIRLSVLDDSGRSEVLNFSLFLDQTQLAKGLSEFGLYAGVKAPLGLRGPHYTNDYIASGFYRRGISDFLTVGVNAQIDKDSRLLGTEAVVATSVGTFATNLALSDIDAYGSGYAGTLTFQRLIQRANGQADTLNLFAETRSAKFGPVSSFYVSNPYDFEVGGGYSHAFTDQFYAGFDARYSHGRGAEIDLHSYRLSGGFRISPTANLTGDVRYEKDTRGSRIGAFASLTIRFGRYTTARADYDTRDNRARVSFQTLHGQGVGSYNITADIDRSDNSSGFNFNGNYIANRAELGLSHFGSFTDDFGQRTSERTSLRVGTSLAFADGAFSVGRPIYDSFAIVSPHRKLDGTDVLLDPTPYGYTANSGMLGAATHPSLSSYADRTITVDAPDAKAGTDLGQGSFHLFPPYRSGYRLVVGSEYGVTAVGTMVDVDGEVVSLVTGTATELAHPELPPVTIFTNRQGRFGATGLAPGKWRIEMLDSKQSVFEIDIPDNGENIVRFDQISPVRN
ncbi:fimbrial biogenesis outer membrane usher protein [Sphingorhabdus soli]|uniref:Fimbrial biogenesis outer membrane usher protein n=1 Tax=Flavisphingopyxis soli TaxID=2601267 RepID=A0A5C6UL93_9SPHN|nr:fimbrial biogenesis outer membrane usher protein [Sphingorhabdus soli]TXC73270.1 fimbrial biogenesis outer membrane usher protein [Sphingorhabdus soli]